MGATIEIVDTMSAMRRAVHRFTREGKAIAFVPTMGFLHEGHLALMREARRHGDAVIISIFVNPTQFGPSEDFTAYPRDLDRDITLADSVGVDIVFAPSAERMYGPNHETFVDLGRLPGYLCGVSRPGHFRGVATVVTKLFNVVKPDVAVFGRKDYQQLLIIRRLVENLNYDIRVVGVPTVREADGLAMSSRNAYLSPEERASACSLFKGLEMAQQLVGQGTTDATVLIEQIRDFITAHPHTTIDYVALCDPESLEPMDQAEGETLMALAVWVGSTRLIDNAILEPRTDRPGGSLNS